MYSTFNNKLEETMKKSKMIAIVGLVFSAVMMTGCLQGPVADGGFSLFPNGVYFDNNN
tara:strand:- start:180 stop:353 length:174 start_codon:yes stop_codon:yes gene_type:complete